jgi:non-ribosomal peptide synthetase component E (peptide arylation enzyme)
VIGLLTRRSRTGVGGTASVAQTDVALTQMADRILAESQRPGALKIAGNVRGGDVPRGLFPCAGDEDGYLFLTDRDSFMIISGGVNIYPQEIENAIVEHPKVLDAGVVGMPDPELGEIVTAAVIPVPGIEGDDDLSKELLDYLSGKFARFKIPRRIIFTSDLPRLPTGKLAKDKLKKQLLAQDQTTHLVELDS